MPLNTLRIGFVSTWVPTLMWEKKQSFMHIDITHTHLRVHTHTPSKRNVTWHRCCVTIKIVSGCWSLTILNVGIIKKYVRLLYAFLINAIKRISTICFFLKRRANKTKWEEGRERGSERDWNGRWKYEATNVVYIKPCAYLNVLSNLCGYFVVVVASSTLWTRKLKHQNIGLDVLGKYFFVWRQLFCLFPLRNSLKTMKNFFNEIRTLL